MLQKFSQQTSILLWVGCLDLSQSPIDNGKSNVKTAVHQRLMGVGSPVREGERSWETVGSQGKLLSAWSSTLQNAADQEDLCCPGIPLSQFSDEPPHAFCSFGCLPPGPPTEQAGTLSFLLLPGDFFTNCNQNPLLRPSSTSLYLSVLLSCFLGYDCP